AGRLDETFPLSQLRTVGCSGLHRSEDAGLNEIRHPDLGHLACHCSCLGPLNPRFGAVSKEGIESCDLAIGLSRATTRRRIFPGHAAIGSSSRALSQYAH